MGAYEHRETIFPLILMVVFAAIFFLSYYLYKAGKPVIDIGLEAAIVDWVVMVLAVVAIARAVMMLKHAEFSSSRMHDE